MLPYRGVKHFPSPRGPASPRGSDARRPRQLQSRCRFQSQRLRVELEVSQTSGALVEGLLFWLFKRGFKVSSGTVEWYVSSYGTDFDDSEIARPVI